MRILLALSAALVAIPAHATGGVVCTPANAEGPTLSVVIGHGLPPGVIGAHVIEKDRTRSTFEEAEGLVVAQSWIDEQRVWLDLVDVRAMRVVAKLRAAHDKPFSLPASGTFEWHGRNYAVRCVEG